MDTGFLNTFNYFLVPPAAIAVILAYFTAPLLYAVRNVIKLPLTLATLFVMAFILVLLGGFTYIALHALIEVVPTIERHLAPFTQNTDFIGKVITFLEGKIVEYGHAMLKFGVTAIQSIFQHIFSFFIFLIAYFFALRESGNNRFWFLVYFPHKIRLSTKRMLLEASKLISTFVSLEARLMFLTFIILTIGFSLLKFNSPIGMAFLVTLVDSLPFLGTGIFLIPMAAFFLHTDQLLIGISLILLYLFTITTRQLAESYMWASTFQLRPVHAFSSWPARFTYSVCRNLINTIFTFCCFRIKQHKLSPHNNCFIFHSLINPSMNERTYKRSEKAEK